MVHSALSAPTSSLWIYVFVVIILLVLSWIGASKMAHTDPNGNMRTRGGLGFLIIAILLGIIIYFLVAADIQQWAWFITLLPTAILLFTIYFIFFGVFGQIMLWIGLVIAFFVMVWIIYFAFVESQWSLLAFPIIYLIILIGGGFGMSTYNKWQNNDSFAKTENILNN